MSIIYPQLDGVKINPDRSLPVALIQAIRKAYDYLATGNVGGSGETSKAVGGGVIPPDGGGLPGDVVGPVTGISFAGEIGTRYVTDPDRLVHLTLGLTPICPVPQMVTYLVSTDFGLTWKWIGNQREQTAGQQLKIDQLAPSNDSQWMLGVAAGNLGGSTTPITASNVDTLYPGLVRSTPFTILGLSTPTSSTGITATIGTCSNVVNADGFTQSGVIPGLTYTDPTTGTYFFVRITVQDYDIHLDPLTDEQPFGGTQITGGSHLEHALLVVYIPGLAYVRFRFYVANRNSQGGGDFIDPTTNTLQMVAFNGNTTLADHYDVGINIPPFTPPDPGGGFNVTSVTASEIGPKYQDTEAGLHTVIGVIPVIDADYSSPRTVTIWFDFGTGTPIWQGWFSLTSRGELISIGDATLSTDGVRKSGNIWVPANTTQGNWIVYCAGGHLDDGIDPTPYASFHFTVIPVAPCLPNGTTQATFIANPNTGNVIDYSLWYPGIWYWEYYELMWVPPSLDLDPNYWFTLVTVQKGATIGGIWTPAPDSEGVNEDPNLNFLGRKHVEVMQLPGTASNQSAIIRKFGANPATWVIPVAQNPDQTVNPYREFRFLIYNVSRLGTDTSGSGGDGTYTLQTNCWPGNTSFFILIPQVQTGAFDVRAANPAYITAPLTGGNGQPMTLQPGAIDGTYLADQSVHEQHMAAAAITAANNALAANAVVNVNVHDVSINKVTYGTSVFAGDVILSRGLSMPVINLKNDGFYMYGQADASTGTVGLLTKPYAVIQSSGIALFHGGTPANPGGSIFLDASVGAITIYSRQLSTGGGDVSFPYFTVNSGGLTAVNGTNSMAINSNAMLFLDKQFHNRIDINSAGITITNGLKPDFTPATTSNQVIITSAQIQFALAQIPQITLDASLGITISNGTPGVSPTSSVVLTSALVKITNGNLTLADPNFTLNIDNASGIKMVAANGTFFQTIGLTSGAGGGILTILQTPDGINVASMRLRGVSGATYGEFTLSGNGSGPTVGTAGSLTLRPGTSPSASAGSASLPTNPVGFLVGTWNGTIIHIPYYS